jgi:hypothetical protein
MLPQIPKDWDDRGAWETYYREYCLEERWKSWPSLDDLGWGFVSQLAERQYRAIWFPGCGASLAPRLYAALGFDVFASDVSQAAIDFQGWTMTQPLSELGVSRLIEDATGESLDDEPCTFEAVVHDLAEPLPKTFDAVLNHLSYHGFSARRLPDIARSHAGALREGGMAIFVMGNVSRSKREPLEVPLSDAGFYMPYFESESWFRERLRESLLPHRFISNKVALRIDEEPFRSDKTKREEAQRQLEMIEAEYNTKMRQEDQVINARLEDPTSKTAILVYGSQ